MASPAWCPAALLASPPAFPDEALSQAAKQ
jgi:hypothetical protein